MARLAGLEPTASSSAGMRSIHLSYKRASPKPTTVKIGPSSGDLLIYWLVPKEGLEPTRPFRALHPECSASTIPPLRHVLGVYPTPPTLAHLSGGRSRGRTSDLLRVKQAL